MKSVHLSGARCHAMPAAAPRASRRCSGPTLPNHLALKVVRPSWPFVRFKPRLRTREAAHPRTVTQSLAPPRVTGRADRFAGRNFQKFHQQSCSTQPATPAGTRKGPKHRQNQDPHPGGRESQRVSQKKPAEFPPTNPHERICRKKLSKVSSNKFARTNLPEEIFRISSNKLLDPTGNKGGHQNGQKVGNSLVPDEAA